MIDTAAVKAYLRLDDTADDLLIDGVVEATNLWVAGLPYLVDDLGRPQTWPADVRQGAMILAARLYRRRNTPAGLDMAVDGAAVYLPRRDSDVDTLLRLRRPRVG